MTVRLSFRQRPARLLRPLIGAILAFVCAAPAFAGSVSWLDDLVQDVIKEAEAGAKVVARSSDNSTRTVGRLFAKEAGESIETITRRYDDFARAGRRGAAPSELLLESRFRKLLQPTPDALKAFSALAPAEKRVVVEMGEVAQGLARKFPGQAEDMVRTLGTQGMAAVRVYGDDIAPVVVKEGAESLNVLRKSGASGWKFYTEQVLKNKKKLAASGVLALYMADPDRFIDGAGQITAYAVDQFARAGVQIAGAVGSGVVDGLGQSFSTWLTGLGINLEIARYLGVGLAGTTVILAAMVLLGFPIRWVFKPFGWVFRLVRGKKARQVPTSV